MDNGGSVLSLSAPHFPYSATTILRRHSPAASISYSLKPQPPQPPPEPPESPDLRRPEKSLGSSPSSSSPNKPKVALKNPLKGLSASQPEAASKVSSFGSALASKLRLSSKLSPPPPPPPPPVEETHQFRDDSSSRRDTNPKVEETREFRQEGKIFVGNLPTWIKKPELEEFFRQFGPIETTILIKGHREVEKNAGFGFVIYAAEKSAMKAVEFDGVEFHGRVLTVKLDDGKRLKTMAEQRARWVEQEGEEGEDAKMSSKSSWHQEREGSRKTLQRILDSDGDNWQAVVSAFEKINKVLANILFMLIRLKDVSLIQCFFLYSSAI